MTTLLSRPGGKPDGCCHVPGDKSISHRALLLSALSGGETEIFGLLTGHDCLATAGALRALGADISIGDGVARVCREAAFSTPADVLDLGNSGTGLRLLAGMLAGLDVEATLTGDASLRGRPMERIAAPLRTMGARVETSGGSAPLRVRGVARLRGIEYRLPVASAQVKSAILLAGVAAKDPVVIHEPASSRDHTERMLRAMGADIACEGQRVRLAPHTVLRSPGRIDVPGDLSSAAFLLAAAALSPGAVVTVLGVGVNPTRAGFLDMLSRMGAKVSLDNLRDQGFEPVADVTVEGATLRGIEISADDVALAIDEIPVLLALAAVAEGETIVRGAGELRVKESDRLAAMSKGLAALGVSTELRDESICVFGGQPQGGVVDSAGDHRIAMSFAILGQCASGPVEIRDCANVATSFPGFTAAVRGIGLELEESER